MTQKTTTGSERSASTISAFLLNYGIIFAIFLLYILLTWQTDAFLSLRNQLNILDQAHQIGLIAVAATVVIIAGGFDLSTGAIFAMSGVVAAMVARDLGTHEALAPAAPWMGWAAGIAAGAMLGLLNGVLVTFFRINTFVATLSTGIVFRGFALLITQAEQVRVVDRAFRELARGDLLGVRFTVFIWLGFALALSFILFRTRFGRLHLRRR